MPIDPNAPFQAFCECPSYNCHQKVMTTTGKYADIQKKGLIVISNQCVCPPLSGDVLVETCEGFKVYKPDPNPSQAELDKLP